MGNWQLEIFKFSLYVFAPVASFYIYHKIDFFSKDLERYERKVTTPALVQNEKQIKEDLEFLNSLREESLRRKFESEMAAATNKNKN
jgi:sigma54-dependent transcription regulator